MEEEKFEFKCRICGGSKYKKVQKSNGILGPVGGSWTLYCHCEGCGVLFKDPKKFSVVEMEKEK